MVAYNTPRHAGGSLYKNLSLCERMQKALEQMNIKLANVISDITGKTGRLIMEVILKGERDPQALAKHRDRRNKAGPKILLKSLEGNWREE